MRRLEQAIAPREPINFRFKPAGLAGIKFKVWFQASIPCRAALVPLTPALSELNINVNWVLVCRNTSTLLHIHLLAPPSRTGQTRQEFQMISMTPAFVAKECWLRRVESQRHQAGFQEAQRARSTSYIFVRFVSRRAWREYAVLGHFLITLVMHVYCEELAPALHSFELS